MEGCKRPQRTYIYHIYSDIHIYTYTYIHIYIYIEREREKYGAGTLRVYLFTAAPKKVAREKKNLY